MEWSFEVVTRAHPKSEPQWYLTDEAIDRFVLDAPGKRVTWDYNSGHVVGRAVSAERREDGSPWVTLELDGAGDVLLPDGRPLGDWRVALAPAMSNPNAVPNPPAGPLPMDADWRVVEFALVPVEAGEQDEDDAMADAQEAL